MKHWQLFFINDALGKTTNQKLHNTEALRDHSAP